MINAWRSVDLPDPVLPGDEDVLRGPLAELQVLQPIGARPSERNVDPGSAVALPVVLLGRGDDLEGDFDAVRLLGGLADRFEQFDGPARLGGLVDGERERLRAARPSRRTGSPSSARRGPTRGARCRRA